MHIIIEFRKTFCVLQFSVYLNSLNFLAPFIFAHLVCAKIKGERSRTIFAHFDARKLMSARNNEVFFQQESLFKGSNFIF